MNIGVVPYLNALPLIRGLPFDLRKAPPATLARLLRIGEIDLATAPVTTLFEHPEWRAVPGIAIGTKQEARSVLLCMRSPDINIHSVRSIYIDMESRTSALLLKVLLAIKYERPLDSIEFQTNIPSPDFEAKMIIGDKALKEQERPTWEGPRYDLGEQWTEWTKLPFVFACWVSRRPTLDTEVLEILRRSPDRNLQELDSWISTIEGYEPEILREYFTENMNYGLGREEQQGLATFYQYLRELEIYDRPFQLRFVNP